MPHFTLADILTSSTLVPSPKREGAGLPSIYKLKEAHPCRNPNFTRDLYPAADQAGFQDYVALVEKTEDFMRDWLRVSETLTVPTDKTPEENEADGRWY